MGGKVLKNMGKSATHLVWANGKLKTLLKASELNLQIVSPLWIKACTEQDKLVSENGYRPSKLEEKIKFAKNQQAPTELKKKRAAPDQLTLIETRNKENEDLDVVPKTEDEINETAAYLDRVRKQRKDEQYFQREFAKDMKKFSKPPEESKAQKGDIYDQFVDGELTVVEFVEKVTLKQSRVKQSKKRQLNQTVIPVKNRRLDEFYNNNAKLEKRADPNRSAFINLNDMLQDLESSEEAITAKFVEQ